MLAVEVEGHRIMWKCIEWANFKMNKGLLITPEIGIYNKSCL